MAHREPVRVPRRVPPKRAAAAARRPRDGYDTFFGRIPGIHRRGRHRTRGQALVELALVTPIILILLLAAIDLGRIYYVEITLANSAREAAMTAATTPSGFTAGAACNATTNPVMCAATREGQGGLVTIATSDVAMTCAPSCSQTYGAKVTMTVTGHFQVITPLIWVFTGGSDVAVTRSATANVIVTPAAGGIAPTPTPTVAPTPTPTVAPTPTPTSTSGPTPTPTPTATPTPTPSPTPTCPPPSVNFSYSQQNKNKPVNFSSTSTPTAGACAISYWRWDFGDTTTSAGAISTATHSYASQGANYQVTLTVTTPSGTFSFIGTVHTLP